MDLSFFSSPFGAAVAWVFTVFGFIYSIVKRNEAAKINKYFAALKVSYNNLKIENKSLDLTNSELRIVNTNLEQKIVEIENSEISVDCHKVSQKGKNNVNQGVVKGDVNLELK
ncbi:hypothetical protein [Halomonas sp. HAL1]|uniref:hypothetical protein n=1 Tax=Halomonas sp. HAL1 TaxID=550984 RepID=UPI00022D3156|nr:hypothetical protein [Halomonas sp. HAL1]EHA13628.1 hypothetical protein HAL1_20590 [Halomonas sp. HAL1]WKV91858.1 hypothetical protein Q3Y66_13390 [Halomonas sp. HAL1]